VTKAVILLFLSLFLTGCTARFSFMEPVVVQTPYPYPPPVVRR
jgi:hypothetical protein